MNASNSFDGFDDLGSDFDVDMGEQGAPETIEDASGNKSLKVAGFFVENCSKCGGNGRYNAPSSRGIMCFKCNGTGKLTFKKSAADRAASREKSAKRAADKQSQNIANFEAANPEIAAWWNSVEGDFAFSQSLKGAATKFGALTERQHAAALKCIATLADKKAAAERRKDHAESLGPVDVREIAKALDKAMAKGLQNPKIRLVAGETTIVVYYAARHSLNAGSLYVKTTGEDGYLGKIKDGTFFRARNVSDDLEADIVRACATPAESAVAYGIASGKCSCCGRKLTNKLSIELGIGPICRETFFG